MIDISKVPDPPKCDICHQRIWNPEWWEDGLCGPCTTGESETLFPDNWVPPHIEWVRNDEKFLIYWKRWMKEIWVPEAKEASDYVDSHPELFADLINEK